MKKSIIGLMLFCLLSCYSGPVSINGLVDYSDITSPDISYYITILIYNRNLLLLKQNIVNEIIKNNGEILRTDIPYKNRHVIEIKIKKNDTMQFIENIKKFGITVEEGKTSNRDRTLIEHNKTRLENLKYLLEKYIELLKSATSIVDKVMLEKEIISTRAEIDSAEDFIKRSESDLEYNHIRIDMYR